jgi:hypothetical protein
MKSQQFGEQIQLETRAALCGVVGFEQLFKDCAVTFEEMAKNVLTGDTQTSR